MDPKRLVKVSRYLSKHLRHMPQRLGLCLAPGGWVEVETLLAACARQNFTFSRQELEQVVAENDKQRFSFDSTGTLIRANQGHSVAIDLQLEPAQPPEILYHGTGQGSIALILRDGLKKMKRHHVHLSRNFDTAVAVGARHGTPVVFTIDTAAMLRDGFTFFCSENEVWLVDSVPPEYLRVQPSSPHQEPS